MRLRDARILHVDDEPLLVEIFGHWLAGCIPQGVSSAADGVEALEVLSRKEFDLLVTDVNMPRMNGVLLVRSIAELGLRMPSIVFVSGFGKVDEREMYGLGVEAFLSKPTTRETLIAAAERAVAEREDLWKTPMDPAPPHSLSIYATGFSESATAGGIAMGRGGFSAPYSDPAAPGKVNFDCYLSERDTRFSGQGYIRWVSRADSSVGIEISYLCECCRPMILEEIQHSKSRAFIPSK